MSPAYEWRQRTAYGGCSQAAYAEPMRVSSLRHLRRKHWANELLQLVGGNVAEMARQIETPRTHLSALLSGSKGIGDALAAKMEAAFDRPAGWLDREVFTGEAAESHGTETRADKSAAGDALLAHSVSQRAAIVIPKTIVWEDLVRESIEGQFLLAVKGEALMPAYPPGQMAIWQACDHTAAKPGQAVLVQLPGGRFELRFFEPRGTTWAGISQRVGHAELQPERDQAAVVARLRYLDLG
jgi:hypothetical protein